MSQLGRFATLLAPAIAAAVVADARPARADLLNLERWANNQGGWVNPAVFLVGDFDGNGKDDLAYVWQFCGGHCVNVKGPGPAYADWIAEIDEHLSCDNVSVPCPAGMTTSGAFVNFEQVGDVQDQGDGLGLAAGDIVTLFSGLTIDGDCNGVTGRSCMWIAGDYNGDGKTDVAFAFKDASGAINIAVGVSLGNQPPRDGLAQFQWSAWATQQGGFVNPSTFLAGDFNGDGLDDLAYVFNDGGGIDIDVHVSTGSAFTANSPGGRWATNQGGWISTGAFVASDFNGDGFTDIGLAWNDGGGIDLDAHLSQPPNFTWHRWATGQGAWISTSQWTAVPGLLNQRGPALRASLITDFANANPPGDGLGGAGLGDFIFVFDDNGGISIDGHLATLTEAPLGPGLFGTGPGFNLMRYATQQGTYPDEVEFVGGDFNGDSIGDVADPFAVGGQIQIDVHSGNCQGDINLSGQCCGYAETVCSGACCFGSCNGGTCCPWGQTCPPPGPPPPPR